MLRKKKWALFFSFFFFLFLFFLGDIVGFYVKKKALLKGVLFTYEKVELSLNGVSFSGIKAAFREKKSSLQAPFLQISFSKKITLENPHLYFFPQEFPSFSSKKRSSFFSLNSFKGSFSFQEEGRKEPIESGCVTYDASLKKLFLGIKRRGEISVKKKGLSELEICCFQAPLSQWGFLFPFENLAFLGGRITGEFSWDLQENKLIYLKTVLQDLSLKKQDFHIFAKKIDLQANFPLGEGKYAFYKDNFLQKWGKNPLFLEVLGLEFFLKNTPLLQKGNLSFSYNPLLGSKIELQAEAFKKEEVQLVGRSVFSEMGENWLTADITFPSLGRDRIFFEGKGSREGLELAISFPFLKSSYFTPSKDLFSFLDWKWERGNFKGFLQFLINSENTQLVIKEAEVEDVFLAKQEENFCIKKGELSAKASWKGLFPQRKDFFVHKMDSLLEGIFYEREKVSWVQEGKGHVKMQENLFCTSHLSGLFHQFETNVQIKGPLSFVDFVLQAKGKGKNLPENWKKKVPAFVEEDIALKASGKILEKKLLFSSEMFWEREELFFKGGGECLYEGLVVTALQRGWLFARKFPLEKLNFFWQGELKTEGESTFLLNYEEDTFSLEGEGRFLACKTEDFHFFLPQAKKPFHIFWEKGKREWNIDVSLEEASLFIPEKQLFFEKLRGVAHKRGEEVLFSLEQALCKGVSFEGKGFLQFMEKDLLFELFADKIKASLQQSLEFSSQFMKKRAPFAFTEGKFCGEELYVKGFLRKKEDPIWSFHGEIFEGNTEAFPYVFLEHLSAKIEKKQEGELCVRDLQADLFTVGQKNPLRLYVPFFSKEEKGVFCDARIEKKHYELARTKFFLQKQGEGYTLSLDPVLSHLIGKKMKLEQFLLKEDFSLEVAKGSFFLDLEKLSFFPELSSYWEKKLFGQVEITYELGEKNWILASSEKVGVEEIFEAPLQFLAKKEAADWCIESCKLGRVVAQGRWQVNPLEVNRFFFSVEEPSCFRVEGDFSLQDRAKISGNLQSLWIQTEKFPSYFKNIQGDLQASGCFFIYQNALKHQELKEKAAKETSENNLLPIHKKETLSWQVDLDFSPQKIKWKHLTLFSEKPTYFHYSSSTGALLKGLSLRLFSEDVDLSSLFCKVGALHFDDQWFFEKAEVHLKGNVSSFLEKALQSSQVLSFISPSWLIDETKRDLEWTGDIRLATQGDSFSFDLKELYIPIREEIYTFKDLSFTYEPQNCFLKGRCFREKTSFFFQAKADLFPFLRGEVVFQEKEEEKNPLTIVWSLEEKEFLRIQEMKGNFFGIEASLFEKSFDKKKGTLLGTLYFDFFRFLPLLPSPFRSFLEKAQLGEGYELKGLFSYDNIPRFEGIVTARDFEIGGFRFKTLLSKIEWDPLVLQLKDLKMSDSCGMLKLESLCIEKTAKGRKVYIPKIQVKEFRPSLMKKPGKEPQALQPFLIRSALLEQVQGYLEDMSSFTAKGSLFFINSFKREHTLLDIPSDVLGRIFGLDLELLIPVRGDVELQLKEGRFLLTALNEAYSENNRSKFFLVEKDTPAYIDLQGNLHINVKMKQYVLFKFTENFIIKIRGNLQDPKWSLNRKKSFFSDM